MTVAAALAVDVLPTWWSVDCDDGCGGPGLRTGYQEIAGLTGPRMTVALILAATAFALAFVAFLARCVIPFATVVLTAAGLATASVLIRHPHMPSDAPIVVHHAPWYLACGLAAAAVAIGAWQFWPRRQAPADVW